MRSRLKPNFLENTNTKITPYRCQNLSLGRSWSALNLIALVSNDPDIQSGGTNVVTETEP